MAVAAALLRHHARTRRVREVLRLTQDSVHIDRSISTAPHPSKPAGGVAKCAPGRKPGRVPGLFLTTPRPPRRSRPRPREPKNATSPQRYEPRFIGYAIRCLLTLSCRTHRLDEVKHALANGGISNPVIRAHQFQRLALGKRIVGRRAKASGRSAKPATPTCTPLARGSGIIVKKETNGHIRTRDRS